MFLTKQYKDILDEINRQRRSLDAPLVGAISCATGKDAKIVIEELKAAKEALNSKGVTSLLLIAQFHNLELDNLFGTLGNGEDKVLRKRLDKVEKVILKDDPDNNDGDISNN